MAKGKMTISLAVDDECLVGSNDISITGTVHTDCLDEMLYLMRAYLFALSYSEETINDFISLEDINELILCKARMLFEEWKNSNDEEIIV